jgi:hypothetical protein
MSLKYTRRLIAHSSLLKEGSKLKVQSSKLKFIH